MVEVRLVVSVRHSHVQGMLDSGYYSTTEKTVIFALHFCWSGSALSASWAAMATKVFAQFSLTTHHTVAKDHEFLRLKL